MSVVNFYGNIVFDTLVKPCYHHKSSESEENEVVDYREWITGIKAIDLLNAPSFGNIEPIIQKILKGKTIVGHSLADDLGILKVDVGALKCTIRDISSIELFMKKVGDDDKSNSSGSKLSSGNNLTIV